MPSAEHTAWSGFSQAVLQWCQVWQSLLMLLYQWSRGIFCHISVPRLSDSQGPALPTCWVCNKEAGMIALAPSSLILLLVFLFWLTFFFWEVFLGVSRSAVSSMMLDTPTLPAHKLLVPTAFSWSGLAPPGCPGLHLSEPDKCSVCYLGGYQLKGLAECLLTSRD
jgi:hypothetical protein